MAEFGVASPKAGDAAYVHTKSLGDREIGDLDFFSVMLSSYSLLDYITGKTVAAATLAKLQQLAVAPN